MTSLGLPQILITFSSQATTAITRSARGVVGIILNDKNVTDEDGVKYRLTEDSSDIPSSGIESGNIDLLNKTLLGTPYKVHAYFIPPATHEEEQEKIIENIVDSDTVITDPDTGETSTQTIQVTLTDTTIETVTVNAEITQADALKKCANVKINYICHPTGTSQDQQSLGLWTISQRENKHRTCKAVVAKYAADNYDGKGKQSAFSKRNISFGKYARETFEKAYQCTADGKRKHQSRSSTYHQC